MNYIYNQVVHCLVCQLEIAKGRLTNLKSGSKPAISPAEKLKLEKNYRSMVKEWKKRKNIVMDIANTVLESYPKSKKEFYEDVGLEGDGDLKIPKI